MVFCYFYSFFIFDYTLEELCPAMNIEINKDPQEIPADLRFGRKERIKE